jgi:hypothetical protein
MKVSKAIELLRELNPDEEIAISWWEANLFTIGDGVNDTVLPADSEEWLRAVEVFDANGGYDSVNQDVWTYLNYDITEQGEF